MCEREHNILKLDTSSKRTCTDSPCGRSLQRAFTALSYDLIMASI